MRRQAHLPSSRPLLDWLKAHAGWRRRSLSERSTLAWQAHWGSLNARLSRSVTADAGTADLLDPVLILGPWRSGSTAMHNLLAQASGYPTPRTWQCMNPNAFSLQGRPPDGLRAVARPMDGMAIAAESPQEDEFALLGMGCASHYRGFLAPERLDELTPMLQQSYWLDDASWLSEWEWFLRAVRRAAPATEQSSPLLLKSPNHTFRLRSILHRFPRSRLIWMVRDGAAVFQSNRKMWTEMIRLYGAADFVGSEALDRFIAQALAQSAQALQWCTAEVDPRQWAVVEQSRLANDPDGVIEVLRERWGSDWTAAPAQALDPHSSYPISAQAGVRAIPDEACRAIEALNAAQVQALAVGAGANVLSFGRFQNAEGIAAGVA